MSDQRKPRGHARIRGRETARIIKAVRQAGGGEVTLNPETGLYTISVASEAGAPPDTTAANPWDVVYAADSKRPA
jgi:hypothetical protein